MRTNAEDKDEQEYRARVTGAFNTSQSAPPLHATERPSKRPSKRSVKRPVEPKTEMRRTQEAPTKPDHQKPPSAQRVRLPSHEPVDDQLITDAIETLGGKLSVGNVRGLIVQECRAIADLLLEKNAAYGNSALDPVRLFSRSSAIEQLFVRIDDKLSRISRGDCSKVKEESLKVVINDLIGYLILVRVAWRLGLT